MYRNFLYVKEGRKKCLMYLVHVLKCGPSTSDKGRVLRINTLRTTQFTGKRQEYGGIPEDSLLRGEAGGSKSRVILGYIASLRTVWDSRDPVSKGKEKEKKSLMLLAER